MLRRRWMMVGGVGGLLAISGPAMAASIINAGTLTVSTNRNLPAVNPSPSPPGTPVDGQISGNAAGTAIVGTTTLNQNLSLTVSRLRQDTLNISGSAGNDTAKVIINPSVPVVGTPAGDDAYVSVLKHLNIASSGSTFLGTLDVGNNDLIIDYTGGPNPHATIEAAVASGYNGGTWQGKGITSSVAAGNPGAYTVAVIDNALRVSPFTIFDGIAVPLSSVIVKFSWIADINLDGLVTTDDAIAFAANYLEGAPATHHVGDLNYNGVFDTSDAILFAAHYDSQLAHLPEPASVGLLLAGLPALLMRTRRSRHA